MTYYHVNYSKKGQMKIQQMAFVLVALMIFFGMVALFYFSIRIANLGQDAQRLSEEQAKETVRKMGSAPEFIYSVSDCAGCIDMDKVFFLKGRKDYKNFWSLDYLQIEKLDSTYNGECNGGNYPNCKTISIINSTSDFGSVVSSFAALCYWNKDNGGYTKCELGRISVSGKGIK